MNSLKKLVKRTKARSRTSPLTTASALKFSAEYTAETSQQTNDCFNNTGTQVEDLFVQPLSDLLPMELFLLRREQTVLSAIMPWFQNHDYSSLNIANLFAIRAKVLLQFSVAGESGFRGFMDLSKCFVSLTQEGYLLINQLDAPRNLTLVPRNDESRSKWLKHLSLACTAVKISDYRPLFVLGGGEWSRVLVCSKAGRPGLSAVKEVVLSERCKTKHVVQERIAMARLPQHNFVVNLRESVRVGGCLYLAMEFLPGGDLFTYLNKNRRISKRVAMIYAAEVLLALEHLHANDIIHRDLKPENILVGRTGHLKLADLGLAKVLDNERNETSTLCGTLSYIAPEMLKRLPYGKSVDFWMFGCFLYELHVGTSPFWRPRGRRQNVRRNILAGRFHKPEVLLSDSATDTIKLLLKTDVAARLGCGEQGWGAVKNASYFRKLETWNEDELLKKNVAATFSMTKEAIVENFDSSYTCQDPKWDEAQNLPVETDEDELFGYEWSKFKATRAASL